MNMTYLTPYLIYIRFLQFQLDFSLIAINLIFLDIINWNGAQALELICKSHDNQYFIQ